MRQTKQKHLKKGLYWLRESASMALAGRCEFARRRWTCGRCTVTGCRSGSKITFVVTEEIMDVSLTTFFVFDMKARTARALAQYARCGGCR
mgnify:CR=1 FL=1